MTKRTMFLAAMATLALVAAVLSRQGNVSPVDAQGLNVTISISKPANGAFLVSGEKAVVSVALNDKAGAALTKDQFSSLNLYIYGPQETAKTVTAVKLLNASTDRSKTPHHYINLLNDPNVQVGGNVLKYNLQPITDEEAGTYIATVYAVRSGTAAFDKQVFAETSFQLGTATIEKQIVEKEKCAACHQGAQNGVLYFKHIDTYRSPFGSPAIDQNPVTNCKSCHNNDGYASYVTSDGNRVVDTIVNRVHGVHMGEELQNPLNTDPSTGAFKDYTGLIFPANVKNCTSCHVDDRYKTMASRQACGTCHDATWFGDAAATPAKFKNHSGGPQANDSSCAVCHPADSGGVKAVAAAHKVAPPAFTNVVELVMSMPANGKYFVAGESPTVGITIKDAATGKVVDPKTIVEPADAAKVQAGEFRRANLYVSGPRANTKPVLTSAAGTAKTYANNDLRVLRNASAADPRITRTDSTIVYQLADVKGLQPGTYTAFVETLPAPPNIGGWAFFNFQVGSATLEKQAATNCADCHGTTTMHTGYFAVQFNPDICKSCHDYERQIAGKSGWTDSNFGFGAGPLSRRVHGLHFGRILEKPKEVHATVDYSEVVFPQDVRNCEKCHDPKTTTTAWKDNPNRLACLACHDSDLANGHATLQTIMPNPADPWSSANQETCKACHGPNRERAVSTVHNISDPYKPPYPRDPAVRGIKP